ncbi:2Fe-2S iron-sulfur cluster-binding protein [Candidatus Electronema sp. PJ]|uniref:2Fe-2S iron-sulfur cluster-binding protein n=1 Tax=Candidatus Electronema sp. PJ TaxID=3401572 RepID=UPI003AA8736E
MSETVTFTIDGREITASIGQTIVQAARQHGIYIPTLCYLHDVVAPGTCRICTVKVNGRTTSACTTHALQGIVVENDTPELNEMRKAIVEMLYVEGNHFCPSCEKSGMCELQALAYRFQIFAPRFDYSFSQRSINAFSPKLLIDYNRCVLCRRCVQAIRTEDGTPLFAFTNRGNKTSITIDLELAAKMSDEQAQKAMNICPVGAIIHKEQGFITPIGQRKYDHQPIGSDITC